MTIKGQAEYKKFLKGKKLTELEAILSNCYVCNGQESSDTDCGAPDCSLYVFSPYGKQTRD